MPKDELDPEDPMELCGIAFPASEEEFSEMGRTVAEEFLRMGYPEAGVLEIFRSPGYLGPHAYWKARGEEAVRTLVRETASRMRPLKP